MQIHVPMPAVAEFPEPCSWHHAVSIVDAHEPRITALAIRAFKEGDETAWSDVQHILYHWNLEELERTAPVTSYARTVRQLLRNAILRVEEESRRSKLSLECLEDFTPERAIEELEKIARDHRINNHPLLVHMEDNGLTPEECVRFLDNYYANNRVFHLHIAAQSLSTPFDLRAELYQNLYDELGAGTPSEAHPLLFLRSYNSLGGTDRVIEPFVGALHLLNTKIYHTLLSGNYRNGLGALGFLELTMPAQMKKLLAGFRKSGLTPEETIFWDLHISLDEEHGDAWFDEMKKVLKTPEDALAILDGGLSVLDARCTFYDSVYNTVDKHRQGKAA
ncbi:MAG TPA: iron-containing redox enzyme family protein [Gammaproteobacteria bacterium]|nr:iron-containing redox enzyme family protein [Gammaproteobacteria bacterium]